MPDFFRMRLTKQLKFGKRKDYILLVQSVAVRPKEITEAWLLGYNESS
jgi:hypothetical protein